MDIGAMISSAIEAVAPIFTFMFENPVGQLLVGLSIIPIGLGIFTALKSAAK